MRNAEERLARAVDKLEIRELMYRYARGVDRKDWELVRSVYHPDAYDDHGGYKGDVDGFIANLKKRHAMIEQSMHVIANCIIEFDGPDSAVVESYFLTFQRLLPGAGEYRNNYFVREPVADNDAVQGQAIGRFVDRVTRRAGEWRIARRAVVFEIYSGSPALPGGALKQNWTVSRRDGEDPIELALREHGITQG